MNTHIPASYIHKTNEQKRLSPSLLAPLVFFSLVLFPLFQQKTISYFSPFVYFFLVFVYYYLYYLTSWSFGPSLLLLLPVYVCKFEQQLVEVALGHFIHF